MLDAESKENPNFDLREHLLDLAEKDKLDKQPSFINIKNLEKIYEKYKAKQAKDTNDMICNMLISKAGDILETIGLIKSGQETSRKLQKKKLFMRHFNKWIAHVTPWVPFLGFVEGGISVGEDMASHAINTTFFPKQASEDDGGSNQTPTEES